MFLPPPQITLANGLRVRLLPLASGSQAAVLVRVHAGAHDAPSRYPGLAHFLEHLLFLGSRGYPAAQSLMPFVQGCGGQLNASTRERHTDFFFQLPAGQLEEGLLRLLDMLAHPLLDPSAQMREREVLHAEFGARGQDIETLCDAALGTAFDPNHPFAGFHAGNRETLPVEDPAFQQALIGYHRMFYHSGQIELLLAGPHQPEQLQQLAALADSNLPAGRTVMRKAPPLHWNLDAWVRLQLHSAEPRLNLGFAFEGLSEHGGQALDYLSFWVTSQAREGLAQRLREEHLCHSVSVRTPYCFAGQGVAVVELVLTERGLAERGRVVEAVLDWLRFFSREACWQPCREEYGRIRQRGLLAAEPLARLRHWVEPMAWSSDADDAAVRRALAALLEQMIASGPVVLTADDTECDPIETCGFILRLRHEAPLPVGHNAWNWQQPSANPWLQTNAIRRGVNLPVPGLPWLGPEDTADQGALMLRWQFADGRPPPGLWYVLWHTLQAHRWAAQQAGVSLRFDDFGDGWCLALKGFAEAIPMVLADLASIVRCPAEESFDEGQRLAGRAAALGGDGLLLRQLLEHLPRLLASPAGEGDLSMTPISLAALTACWQSAQRQGLAVGFSPGLSSPLVEALGAWPGQASTTAFGANDCRPSKGWHDLSAGTAMGETALLLFCPLPERSVHCEAAWRVLSRLMEGPFFRRLRSELQLGYAVFSRFGQFGRHAGMLFGVQSPTASAEAIVEHIETFLAGFAATLNAQAADLTQRTARETADRHVAHDEGVHARAEQAWQGLLAGHGVDHPRQVAAAMGALQHRDLTAALAELRAGAAGWVVVANSPPPRPDWS